MGRLNYQRGDVVGEYGIIYLEYSHSTGRYEKHALMKCHCGKEFTTRVSRVKQGKAKSCGCYKNSDKIHGFSQHKWSNHFYGMMYRCYNPNSKDYQKYHSKGIIVENYLQNIKNYIEYLVTLPPFEGQIIGKLSIDRTNNEGNYTRGNLRWADNIMQETNKRSDTREYTGVYYNGFSYVTHVQYQKVKYDIGSFPSADEAVLARNKFIQDRGFPHPVQVLN